jgi:hypothetical protein
MLDTLRIYEYPFRSPQQNFPGMDAKQNPEAEFAEQFIIAYNNKFEQIHYGTSKEKTLFVREMPVSGNGIADLLVFSWSRTSMQNSPVPDLEQLNSTVRAFEFKLSNWRSGLMQAHRYKYFSHASILVVPRDKLKSARSYMEIFRALRVGLWGFSPETGSIARVYTPRPKQQQIPKYEKKVFRLAAQAVSS